MSQYCDGSLMGWPCVPNDDIVTTIYVNGFPDDFKEREFNNLFSFASGYEGCSLRIPSSLGEADSFSSSPILKCLNSICPPKGQILGFAKFRTLMEAQEACRILNGRMIDGEKGSVLRAEMAKKNLVLNQVKLPKLTAITGTVFNSVTSPSASSTSNSSINLPGDQSLFGVGPGLIGGGRRHSVPTTTSNNSLRNGYNSLSPVNGAIFGYLQQSSEQADICTSDAIDRTLKLAIPGQPDPVYLVSPNINNSDNNTNSTSILSDLSSTTSAATNLFSQQEIPRSAVMRNGTCIFNNNNTSSAVNSPTNINTTSTSTLFNNSLNENPPCNTLYVGNLPNNANEMELRSIFLQCPGFKRLSFKPKIGGSPMCFVEFEDIKAATVAMETLYGTMLSNSVKGGIRLSYSKNPLGVRSVPPMTTYLGTSLYADIFSTQNYPNSNIVTANCNNTTTSYHQLHLNTETASTTSTFRELLLSQEFNPFSRVLEGSLRAGN